MDYIEAKNGKKLLVWYDKQPIDKLYPVKAVVIPMETEILLENEELVELPGRMANLSDSEFDLEF